jgi:hypothetical protein
VSYEQLRPKRAFDPENPPCDDDECILPSSIVYPIMDERMTQGSGPNAPWRAKIAEAKRQYKAAQSARSTNAGAPASQNGDTAMGCQCNQKRDALERERAARQQMNTDSANAWRTPSPDIIDDEQPPNDAATAGMTREQIARANMQRASRDASKTGGCR